MTLKEELEILRGEPIEVRMVEPETVPCIETSDPEKLCKHPVVSVHMITYNHEPYIRQAIEGVMMQKTDFEFELIIGEDCSQDKTREICFEYQKKYPDKIRVLWWHENVSKLGGNSRRCRARCRGEFIALCEGDDYWIDPLKLQKQVDVMRRHPNVGWCFTRAKIYNSWEDKWLDWDADHAVPDGVITGKRHLVMHMFGRNQHGRTGAERSVMTASVLYRRSTFEQAIRKYGIFNWRLAMGDVVLFWGLDSLSDVYCLPDQTTVYNRNLGGSSFRTGLKLGADHTIASFYFFRQALGFPLKVYPLYELCRRALSLFRYQQRDGCTVRQRIVYVRQLFRLHEFSRVLYQPLLIPLWLCLFFGGRGRVVNGAFARLYGPHRFWPSSKAVRKVCEGR